MTIALYSFLIAIIIEAAIIVQLSKTAARQKSEIEYLYANKETKVHEINIVIGDADDDKE